MAKAPKALGRATAASVGGAQPRLQLLLLERTLD
jgi:hypothetical protein